ncbi:Vacuolar membrane protein, putative [Candida maltosa Xu316]|uniref:Vacuolar membrane protein, putative n=1 Tax=Candida maltosa (strain Xu316) TaxID=1245528 RepID=M3HFI8_CANMX|nr:Vacuolar membrane protein, putative [Candida maltosa Xu316]
MSMTNLRLSIIRYVRAFFVPDLTLHSRQKWILGLINLATVVIFWVSSSFLVNAVVEDDSYRKPFLITYINTSCFCFYLIPYLRIEKLSLRQFIEKLIDEFKYSKLNTKTEERLVRSYGSEDSISELENQTLHVSDSSELELDLNINIYETAKLSLQFIVLWFSANLVTNASLSYTSVASQTILSSTSSFFTLIIGYLVAVERINQNKIMGILLSFAGVLIVTKSDTSDDDLNRSKPALVVLGGNLLALAGALIYGVYTILLKSKITIPHSKKEKNLNTHLFFGFVGLFCLVFLWPLLIFLHYSGIETFALPPTSNVTWLILANAAITFVSDFCWCNAVLLTSPLTVTVGLSMTIPLAMIGDWVFKEFVVNLWYIFGATIVTSGFLIINKDEEEDFVESD